MHSWGSSPTNVVIGSVSHRRLPTVLIVLSGIRPAGVRMR